MTEVAHLHPDLGPSLMEVGSAVVVDPFVQQPQHEEAAKRATRVYNFLNNEEVRLRNEILNDPNTQAVPSRYCRTKEDLLTQLAAGTGTFQSYNHALNRRTKDGALDPAWTRDIVRAITDDEKDTPLRIWAPLSLQTDGTETTPKLTRLLSLFNRLGSLASNVQIIFRLDDDSRIHFPVSDAQLGAIYHKLAEAYGPNIQLSRLSDHTAKAEAMFEQLQASDKGQIVERHGDLYFVPHPQFVELFRLDGLDVSHGIKVKCGPIQYKLSGNGGTPFVDTGERWSDSLLELCRYSRTGDSEGIDLFFDKDIELRALSRIINGVRRGQLHIVRDSAHSPDYLAYELVSSFLKQAKKALDFLKDVPDVQQLDPDHYSDINYGNIITQDELLIRARHDLEPLALQHLGIDLNNPETLLGDGEIMHVALGSNMYPVIETERWTTGSIHGIDLSRNNVAYIEEVKHGKDHQKWKQFEDFLLSIDPERYAGCLDRARKKIAPIQGSFADLPKGRYSVIDTAFGAEATDHREGVVRKRIRDMSEALKLGGVFMGRFTINSESDWPAAEGVKLPATALSVKDVLHALQDAGLRILDYRVVGEDLPAHLKLRPDDDMMFVLAVKDPALG
jgi:hypothetical protein